MNTDYMTAGQALQQIRERVEEIKNDREQRFPEAASDGDYFRQGDLYITKIAKPAGTELKVLPFDRQLAPGNTKGSRHCLSHQDVRLYTRSGSDALTGPVLHVLREVTVEHPEHGNVVLPEGWYGVTYQRAYAEELRRVQD